MRPGVTKIPVWRMDAMHEGDGAFCRFYHDEKVSGRPWITIHARADNLRSIGWAVDVYQDEVDDRFVDVLTRDDCIWPIDDTESICAMLAAMWDKSQAAAGGVPCVT